MIDPQTMLFFPREIFKLQTSRRGSTNFNPIAADPNSCENYRKGGQQHRRWFDAISPLQTTPRRRRRWWWSISWSWLWQQQQQWCQEATHWGQWAGAYLHQDGQKCQLQMGRKALCWAAVPGMKEAGEVNGWWRADRRGSHTLWNHRCWVVYCGDYY